MNLDLIMRGWQARNPGFALFGYKTKTELVFQMMEQETHGGLIVESAKGDAVSAYIERGELNGLKEREVTDILWMAFDDMARQCGAGGRSKMPLHAAGM